MIIALELKNFRGFTDLKLTGLGPVNLIVGMNNVGKTSLLEALSLIGGEGHKHEFYKLYRDIAEHGSDGYFGYLRKDGLPDELDSKLCAQSSNGEQRTLYLHAQNRRPIQNPFETGAPVDPNSAFRSNGQFGGLDYSRYGAAKDLKSLAATGLKTNHDRRLTLLSKLLESGEREEQLIHMLRALDERVDAVRILSRHGHSYAAIGFGKKQRIPVSHAGQGMDRVISIFSEILGEKADLVCIDEIENGLHHTALRRIWEGIAEIATRLGVQLFITTHSRECLEAAHRVFSQRPSYDLRVVQLYRVKNEMDGRVLGPEHIEAAVESEIEVRG